MSTFFRSLIHRKTLLYWPANFLLHWHSGFLWYWHGNWTSVLQLICKLFSIGKKMKALFCSGLQGLFSMGSPFRHPLNTNTHHFFSVPMYKNVPSLGYLRAARCQLHGDVYWHLVGLLSASINGTGWNNSNDTFRAENQFGNGLFFRKMLTLA